MNTDATTANHRGKRAAVIVGVVLLIGTIPFLVPVVWVHTQLVQSRAARDRIVHELDHTAVRDAARELLARSTKGSVLDQAQLPDSLRRLGSQYAVIDDEGFLWLEFGGGFQHYGLVIAPEGVQEALGNSSGRRKYTPLEDGIWFYEET